jgi:hypothetical protein
LHQPSDTLPVRADPRAERADRGQPQPTSSGRVAASVLRLLAEAQTRLATALRGER